MRSAALLLLAACASTPPYRTFHGVTFEPSAAAWDPATSRLLVLNDRDMTVYRYEIVEGAPVLARDEHHTPLQLPGGDAALKFEGLTRLPDGRFLAMTAFDRPESDGRRVVRFRFAPQGSIPGEVIPVDDEAIVRAIPAPWFKLEGFAADATHVFLGVRQTGASRLEPKDAAILLRCPFDGARIGAPDRVTRLEGAEGGLSDLAFAPDGTLWMLTSRESTTAHSGALYRVADPLGPPVRRFAAKPEGLAHLPGRKWIVIFDDDRDYKKRFAAYEQCDGLFEIVEY